MKKYIAAFLAITLLFTACNGGESSQKEETTVTDTKTEASDTAAETTALTEADYSSMSEEEIYKLMIDRSLKSVGDTTRLRAALAKAENGEEITIGYIGGSITEGLTAGAEKCWAKLSHDYIEAKYPNATVNYVNAGMSGTPSVLGTIRAQRDLLYAKPDIVFVEFAVNDAQDKAHKDAYEGLVRTILQQENNPAVVLLFTVLETGYTCQSQMAFVGENYDLPMISVPDALTPEFEAGRMAWTDYSDDQSHPNIEGHKMVTDMVANWFDTAAQTDGGELMPLAEPVYSDHFEDMKFIDRLTLVPDSLGDFAEKDLLAQFPNGWVRRSGTGKFTFELMSKNLFLVFHCNKNAKFGSVVVEVEGEPKITVNSNKTTGWNNPEAQLIFDSDEVKQRTVTIYAAEGSEELYFGIMGFGFSDK